MSSRWSCETLEVGFRAVTREAQDTTMDAEEAKLLAEIKDRVWVQGFSVARSIEPFKTLGLGAVRVASTFLQFRRLLCLEPLQV